MSAAEEPTRKLVPIECVILPKDYKPDEERMREVANSIREIGLQHEPLIKDNGEIVQGKLRVAALKYLQVKEIWVKECPSNLEDKEYKIISLHENLKRDNLAWYDQVLQTKELHDIRQEQFGSTDGKLGRPKRYNTGNWGIKDTAKELDLSVGAVSEDINLAKAILADPTLKKIQDKTTAKRVIARKIAQTVQESSALRPSKVQENEIFWGSSTQVLQAFPDNTFDVCITDPPWLEFDADKKLTKDSDTEPVFKEIYRVLRNGSFLYAFVSTQDWIIYQNVLNKIGFNLQKWPLIWHKVNSLSYGTRNWHYQRDYEPILLAAKGDPCLVSNKVSSVISIPPVNSNKLTHPHEKPEKVIESLLQDCSYEGSFVLDPFAGSFVVPAVCKRMRRRYVAIERDQKYFLQGKERLNKKD